MGFILKLVVLLLIVAVGGFAFLTYNPSYDKYGVWDKVNTQLPGKVQKFTCDQAVAHGAASPSSCQTAANN